MSGSNGQDTGSPVPDNMKMETFVGPFLRETLQGAGSGALAIAFGSIFPVSPRCTR